MGKEYDSFFEQINGMYDDYSDAEPISLIDLDTGDTMTVILDDDGSAEKVDMVNSPKHYILNDTLQVKDVREALLQKLMTDGVVLPYEDAYDWITAWEYITRAPFKNGEEDYRKALWYLNNLLDRMEKRQGYVHADS